MLCAVSLSLDRSLFFLLKDPRCFDCLQLGFVFLLRLNATKSGQPADVDVLLVERRQFAGLDCSGSL